MIAQIHERRRVEHPFAILEEEPLPVLCATLLTSEPVHLTNVPRLRDVATMRRPHLHAGGALSATATEHLVRMLMIGQPGAWRPLTDVDYGALRAGFERRGFKPVPAEIMKTAVEMVAHQRRFDSAIEWAGTLKWDGVSRINNSLSRYLGCADTPYTRAVGAYLWTALAGRCLVPGIKADMALILVSPEQGKRKTSVIEAIAPYPDAFVEVSLEHRDEDMSRKMRGKLVAEIAEMRGLKGRDSEAVKAWVSRRREEWTPKYKEFATTYERRLVLIGTANEMGLLSDRPASGGGCQH